MVRFLIPIQRVISLFLGANNIRPFIWLLNKVGDIVTTREKELQKKRDVIRRDYLQLLMEAHTNEKIDHGGNQLEFTQVNLVKKLTTDVSRIANGLINFLL